MKTKEVKRLEANERNEVYRKLTIDQKLDRLYKAGCFDGSGNPIRNIRQITKLIEQQKREDLLGEKTCSNLKK